jgi:aminopeptidase N
MLGDDLFRKCLHGFMERWHGKHPIPWDFFYSFNDISGKNLNWFWDSWYFSHGYIDMAIAKVKDMDITLKNIGGYPAPIDVDITFSDGSKETLHQTPAIWEKDIHTATVHITGKKKITDIEINGGIFMDADMSNNSWHSK